MAAGIAWEIREYFKDFRHNPEGVKGAEARLPILLYLILRADAKGRTFVGVKTIQEDTGYTKQAISGALKWLFEHGAAYNVPRRYRIGREAKLHHRRNVYQLTGIIRLGGKWVKYLCMDDEAVAKHIEEWHQLGEKQLPYVNFSDPEDSEQGSLSEPNSDAYGMQSIPNGPAYGMQSIPNEPVYGMQSIPTYGRNHSIDEGNTEKTEGVSAPAAQGTASPTLAASSMPLIPATQTPLARPKFSLAVENDYTHTAITPVSELNFALKDEVSDCDISGRALYIWLAASLNDGKPLPKRVIENLKSKVTTGKNSGIVVTYPNLLDMYDCVPGFKQFCEDSLVMFVNVCQRNGKKPIAANFVSFLRKFDEMKEGGAPRWFEWQKRNPEQCKTPADVQRETAEQEAKRLEAERRAEDERKIREEFDRREAEYYEHSKKPDEERPEHLHGLCDFMTWEYYIRYGLTKAQQDELAASGELQYYKI